jgi:hypothetical protein
MPSRYRGRGCVRIPGRTLSQVLTEQAAIFSNNLREGVFELWRKFLEVGAKHSTRGLLSGGYLHPDQSCGSEHSFSGMSHPYSVPHWGEGYTPGTDLNTNLCRAPLCRGHLLSPECATHALHCQPCHQERGQGGCYADRRTRQCTGYR